MSRVTYTQKVDENGTKRLLVGADGVATSHAAKLARRVVNAAKMRAPVDTGYLRNSIRGYPVKVSGLKVSVEVAATAEYAAAVHDGIRGRVIVPVRAKVLRWYGPDGKAVFARRAVQGPRAGRPFLTNALKAEAPRMGFRVD